MHNVLFLPACIAPNKGVSFLKREDHKIRLKDHVDALNYWIENSKEFKIVFIDNSNFPKEELRKYVPKIDIIEYLSYDGRQDSVGKGTGSGEINIFKYGFNNSKYLNSANIIVKCSARYTFKGIEKFIMNETYGLVGNFKNELSFMDSRVFGFKKVFFTDYFSILADEIDDTKGVYFEHALAKAAHMYLSNYSNKWTSIPFPLIVNGISAKNNIKYNSTLRSLLTWINFYRQRDI